MSTPSISETYYLLADGMSDVVGRVTAAEWDAPSPCEGWTARDVLAHLIDTQREFLGRHGVDLPAAGDLSDPAAAWSSHVAAVRAALADPTVVAQQFETPFGAMTVGDALLQFYGFDLVAHRWDIAAVTDTPHRFSDTDLDSLEAAIAGWGDTLYSEGVCARGPEAPADADRQTRVLAALGRVG
ncbi:TIGR03086 family metal-binding protein [Millisia brevis]|uniref:TIGR03086 family metal-binding protein n=1 Tax=Millisia brevis TaxID=264148 RepID=UPI00082A5DF9|nr:TIGR03086 family metal-binding protein [Millisia brevis]